MFFSRKCAERPFEHVNSLMRLIPWQNINQAIQERLFELVVGTLDALIGHLSKCSTSSSSGHLPQVPRSSNCSINSAGNSVAPINRNVLRRLVKTTCNFPAFTESQKQQIVSKLDNNTFYLDISNDLASYNHASLVSTNTPSPTFQGNYVYGIGSKPSPPPSPSSSQRQSRSSVSRHSRKSSLERLLDELDGKNSDADKLTDSERRNVFLHLMLG